MHVYETVDSTNARALAVGGDGTVVLADQQSAGRGRHGRTWHSAPGLGLWFSVVFEQPVPGLAFAGPLAVRDALRSDCLLKLKWPNDLLLNGRKVCGILVEHRRKRSVVGVGLNVRHRSEDFPENLRGKAISLEVGLQRPFDRGDLIRRILTELDKRVMLLREGHLEAFRREWASACAIRGCRVRAGSIVGVVREIDDEGGLLVESAGATHRILFGDIIELSEE